ncbi:MAG: beta-galactosidase [Clostridia bacterium]|nr:beta-galactosidase [Clostridia bacterium]
MKRLISGILAVLMMLCTISVSVSAAENADYKITGFTETEGVFALRGILNAAKSIPVTLKAVLRGADASKPYNIKALNQTVSEADGSFEFKFEIEPDIYTVYIKAQDMNTMQFELDLSAAIETDAVCNVLESEIKAAEDMGISADYERAALATAKKFRGYMLEEFVVGDAVRGAQMKNEIIEIAQNAIDDTEAYIEGSKEEKKAVSYISGKTEIDGTTTSAETTDGKRPVFFVGYGHWNYAAENIPYFAQTGTNIIQTELGPAQVVKHGAAPYWQTGYENKVKFDSASGNLHVTYDGGENVSWHIRQRIPVKPNTWYNYGLDYSGSGITDAWYCFNDIDLAEETKMMMTDASSEMKHHSFWFKTGPEQKYVTFTIVNNGKMNELVLDNIFAKEENGENIVTNGDFETHSSVFDEYNYTADLIEINNLKSILKKAKENNVRVSLLLKPHDFPEFVAAYDPTVSENGQFDQFMPFNPTHPKVLAVMEAYIEALIPRISEYADITDIILANEPRFNSSKSAYYVLQWHEYLKNKYKSITALNTNYSSDYGDFSQVNMPAEKSKTNLYYDWVDFNDNILAEFHGRLYNAIKNLNRTIPVSTKIMQNLGIRADNDTNQGQNYEKYAPYVDLNGCDGWFYHDVSWAKLYTKLSWYDLQRSIKNAPVWNTEDHIIQDNPDVLYSDIQNNAAGADIWQGALHGRAGSMVWIWDRTEKYLPWGTDNIFSNSNLTLRPKTAYEISRTAMDLNRLSYEVTAIGNKTPDIAILYSYGMLARSKDHNALLGKAYKAAIFSGHKVDFITETNSQKLNAKQHKVLIIPAVYNIDETRLEIIENYLAQGGKIIVTDVSGESLAKDMNGNAHSAERVKAIINKSMHITDTIENSEDKLISALALTIAPDMNIIDVSSNTAVENVEWTKSEYNGRKLVAMCNYDKKNKTIRIDGVTRSRELRSGKTYTDTIVLEPYKPILLELPSPFNTTDENGNIIKSGVSTITEGYMNCTVNAGGDVFLALYRDGRLVSAAINRPIAISKLETGRYELKCMVWEKETYKPIDTAQALITEVE